MTTFMSLLPYSFIQISLTHFHMYHTMKTAHIDFVQATYGRALFPAFTYKSESKRFE